MERADVSVIIPVYNSMDTIERAVKSVVKQTLLPKEIIIVDDCSTNHMMRNILEYVKKEYSKIIPITIIYSEKNAGPGTARNIGWEVAKGKYIAFLDSDDVWHYDKVKIQFKYMDSHKEVYFACHHMLVISCDDNSFFQKRVSISRKNIIAIDPIKYLFKHYPRGGTPSIMVKNVDLRFRDGMRYSEDYLLWLEYCFRYKGILIDAELAAAYKAIYGAGGLSLNLWKIEKGELKTYGILREEKLIKGILYYIVCAFSLLKYVRREFICRLR